MSEESTTPDLVELTRRGIEYVNRGDFQAFADLAAPDAVFVPSGLGTFRGREAIGDVFQEWVGAFDEFMMEAVEIVEFGTGVMFVVYRQSGRPAGSSGEVRLRYAAVCLWVDGMLARMTTYLDVDEGRAAAELLAESRG